MLLKPIMVLIKNLSCCNSFLIIYLEKIFDQLANLPRITVVYLCSLRHFFIHFALLAHLLVQVRGLSLAPLTQHVVYLLEVVAVSQAVRDPALVMRRCA